LAQALGWALYKKEKLVVLPARVQEIMQYYTEDCDILNNFIDNCCTRGVDLKCTLKEFYDVFSSQYENRRIQQKTLSKRLQDAGFEVDKGTAGRHYVYGFSVDDHTNTMNLLK
jgi:phage/plasmid-associated DNA primase